MGASVARSHVGRVRAVNEDRVFDCPERRLWAVADGMGGHHGGDVAAQMVVEAFRRPCEHGAGQATAMLDAIATANRTIVQHNRAQGADAGSTVVAAQLAGRTATIAWVGDSRAYLIRGETVSQLTHDHSLVQDLIDKGLLTRAAAVHHPQANVVTRALGIAEMLDVAAPYISATATDCCYAPMACHDRWTTANSTARSRWRRLPMRSSPTPSGVTAAIIPVW
jgi:serine/threonine protein phosphatase PrpC